MSANILSFAIRWNHPTFTPLVGSLSTLATGQSVPIKQRPSLGRLWPLCLA
jgi:hypothetical protein